MFNSRKGSNNSKRSSHLKSTSLASGLTGSHWYQVLLRNLWTFLSDFYHHHQPTTTHHCPSHGNPNCHFRSFSRRTRAQLSLLDHTTELFITLLLPAESTLMLAIFLLVALNPMSDSSTSSLFFRSHEAWQLTVLSADAVAIFVVFQAIYKRLMLFYKTLLLICLAWYLHLQEVLGAAVRQMRAAAQYYQFFCRPSISHLTMNQAGKSETKRFGGEGGGGSTVLFSASQRLSAAIGTIWITVFMREHCSLLVDLVHLNRHLVSPLLFWFYSPVLVCSVYILCLLYFMPLAILLKLSLLSIFAVSLITFALLAFLSLVVQTLYGSPAVDSLLFRAQMFCRGSSADFSCKSGGFGSGNPFLRTKLKLMSYYEVLRTEKKVAFTFGSQAAVNSRWLFEVSHQFDEYKWKQ